MTVYLVPNLNKERAISVSAAVAETLTSYGARVYMEAKLRPYFAAVQGIVAFTSEADALSGCDVIVTVGGDGTILHTARRCFSSGKPLLGVNIGRLGFLATVEADELSMLKRLVSGEYILDERAILSVQAGEEEPQLALNEAVIAKTGVAQTIDVSISCDGILVNRYTGDGVIVATPTGSTAYSLSAGGPMLDARIEGIVVTPICAHSMHSPPMVFSAERELCVTVGLVSQSNAALTCDSHAPTALANGESVQVRLSPHRMTLISFNEADQFNAIDKKLKVR